MGRIGSEYRAQEAVTWQACAGRSPWDHRVAERHGMSGSIRGGIRISHVRKTEPNRSLVSSEVASAEAETFYVIAQTGGNEVTSSGAPAAEPAFWSRRGYAA